MPKPDKLPARIHTDQNPPPGFIQDTPPDAISAELRQVLIDLLQAHLGWDGVVLYQGAEFSHWMQISAEELISVQSFLTPRMIADHSGAPKPKMDVLSDVMSKPERLAALLHRATVTMDAGMATGALVGAELAAAKPYWLGQSVIVIGDLYTEALKAQGVQVAQFSS